MSDPRLDALEDLSTEVLRERAFSLARHRLDVSFFLDVMRHLPDAYAAEQMDGSTGSITNTIDDVIGLWGEITGKGRGYGDEEPLIRAAFIDYILKHEKVR